MEGQLFDSLGFHLNFLSDPDELISRCELKRGGSLGIIFMVEGSDSDGTEPSVVPVSVVRNKEGVHLQLFIAHQVESGVLYALEGVAEQVSSGNSDGKVWV